jgi:hypothetical protein
MTSWGIGDMAGPRQRFLAGLTSTNGEFLPGCPRLRGIQVLMLSGTVNEKKPAGPKPSGRKVDALAPWWGRAGIVVAGMPAVK